MRAVKIGAYVVLGGALVFTRLYGISRSYWLDEITTVEEFVRAGPREIIAGHYVPNNHELFSFLAWVVSSTAGESETALRLLSVLPFIAGVALVTGWLHVRVGALAGLTFLFLATVSPLLLDITRQARGYGLAFAAMSVMLVCALELRTTRSTWLVAGFCAAGLVGTTTLPNVGISFVALALVLLGDGVLRGRMALGTTVTVVLSAAWYAPHIDDILEGSRQTYGVEMRLAWLTTAPLDQILIPALIWIDGVVLVPEARWLPLVAAALLLLGASPLLRDRYTALVLASGPVATVLVLWITGTYAVPRFLSYLLVPLFMLMASGIASLVTRLGSDRPPVARIVVAFVTLGLVAAGFVATGTDVVRLPREDPKGAVGAITSSEYASAPVYAHQLRPQTTEFYLGRPVIAAKTAGRLRVACAATEPVVVVAQPWTQPAPQLPCGDRPGIRRYRFEQYTRGGEIVVWLVPP
jgi:hypothetical protein